MNKHTSPSQFIEITEFQPEYATDFARLNYEWLAKYFTAESHDSEMLEDPYGTIIEPGGQILIALDGDKAVGTAALITDGPDTYELAKMAVSEGYKGQKIGKRLMLRAIDYAIKTGKKRLVLESNTSLTPAINLYIKSGFKVVPLNPDSPYERANIKMELIL
ncbi:GNAT family N-acetyltransferase [Sinomicrobium weinanense]|uniref:GNAT family N-acetyltransferase n=1 Tax=Sinomicrobium weinanense TaxID=2842200 RepID=A0A926JNJ4_9FLAO|nr:GNAT family N-acetyltransferase [Sinomicrobium weinanense]MBC9794580.1 GNAT family N-acetyltransferase [Sinomicrobium weinanense]MBU3124065.1 GNAT family N-acetyltransferase [Sinomicrobium weinanense]